MLIYTNKARGENIGSNVIYIVAALPLDDGLYFVHGGINSTSNK